MTPTEIAILTNAALDIISILRTLNVSDVNPENIETKVNERQAIIEEKFKKAVG